MTTPALGHDELISSIVATVADYRIDDGLQITEGRVTAWVEQFDVEHRDHVLRETHAVLDKRYVSKAAAIAFLDVALERLAEKLAGGDRRKFLAETSFLALQAVGKSQDAMLAPLEEITKPLGFAVADCGGPSPKRYLYLDDVLCTGNSLYQDLKRWWMEPLSDGRARQDHLPADVRVIAVFIAIHANNARKVLYRFRMTKDLQPRAAQIDIWSFLTIENKPEDGAALDLCFPRRAGAPPAAEDYLRELGVDLAGAFRPDLMPATEKLFTSSAGRDAFERAVLGKGLEIIRSLATRKANMHPLGFTLPSQKGLGFGALVFTWRNVPNNSPLVFWHSASMWLPLFEKKSGPLVDLDALLRGLSQD